MKMSHIENKVKNVVVLNILKKKRRKKNKIKTTKKYIK
jgi:hypothetical protein